MFSDYISCDNLPWLHSYWVTPSHTALLLGVPICTDLGSAEHRWKGEGGKKYSPFTLDALKRKHTQPRGSISIRSPCQRSKQAEKVGCAQRVEADPGSLDLHSAHLGPAHYHNIPLIITSAWRAHGWEPALGSSALHSLSSTQPSAVIVIWQMHISSKAGLAWHYTM